MVSTGFTAQSNALSPALNIGTASSYSVLGASTVTNTGLTSLSGDLGVSPGTAITGFPPGVIAGTIHSNDASAVTAQADVALAYANAVSQTPTGSITGINLGGNTYTPGVYQALSSAALTGTVTLDAQGDKTAVFLFQMGSTLTTATASHVTLIDGAQACNVYWQVGSSATIGTNTDFSGTVLALTSITVNTGATFDGRALAHNGAVTLDSNIFTQSACDNSTPTPTPTVTATATATATPSPIPSVTPTPDLPSAIPTEEDPADPPPIALAPTGISSMGLWPIAGSTIVGIVAFVVADVFQRRRLRSRD